MEMIAVDPPARHSASRFLLVCLIIVGSAALAFSAYLWRLNGAFRPVEWTAADGGLRLVFVPGKDQASVMATDSYVSGAKRVWVMTQPGATQRFWGAPRVPPPETLFHRANIRTRDSHPRGLVALHADATHRQQAQIAAELAEACTASPELCRQLREVADERQLPWLQEVIEASADREFAAGTP